MKKRYPILLLVLMVLAMFAFVGCMGTMGGSVPFSQKSPKEKLTYMYSVYNSQYADYMTQTGYTKQTDGTWLKTSTPELSDAQREVLRAKKKVLTQVYPLIQLYDTQQQFGNVPSPETEQQIMNLLNSLL